MPIGKSYVLTSGLTTTNAFAYSAKFNTLRFGESAVFMDCITGGSGVSYTLRAYPIQGLPLNTILTSGTITGSGSTSYVEISGVYNEIDVGVQSLQSSYPCDISIMVTGKPR